MLPHLQEVADELATHIDLSRKDRISTDWGHAIVSIGARLSKPEIIGLCKTVGMVGRMSSVGKSRLISILLETVFSWDGDGNLLSTSTVTTIR